MTPATAIHEIDVETFLFFKSLWGRWRSLDSFVEVLTANPFLKAGPILAMIWFFWFVRDADMLRRRTRIISLLAAGFCAALFSVALTKVLPLRPRPMFEPSLGSTLEMPDWSRVSSLPSDHAALFVAMAVGLIFVTRLWGTLALLEVLLFVCLPRAYVGLHYVADLAAGALIGTVFALLFNTRYLRKVSEWGLLIEKSRAPVFYATLFLLTLEIADLFQGARQVADLAARTVLWGWHGLLAVINHGG